MYCEDPAYDRGFDRVEVGRYEANLNGLNLGRQFFLLSLILLQMTFQKHKVISWHTINQWCISRRYGIAHFPINKRSRGTKSTLYRCAGICLNV